MSTLSLSHSSHAMAGDAVALTLFASLLLIESLLTFWVVKSDAWRRDLDKDCIW